MRLIVWRQPLVNGEINMACKCGGEMEVSLAEAVGILKCRLCGRGELILQAKPQEVFDYRARVALVSEKRTDSSRPEGV
jgi:hypothetical protein